MLPAVITTTSVLVGPALAGTTTATGTPTVEESEPTDERTIRVKGTGSYVSYELVTDGGFERTDTLQSGDQIGAGGTTATGGVVSYSDEYTFTGNVTSITLSGPATVFIDGQRVDPADHGENVIEIVGDGSRTTYEVYVADQFVYGEGLSGPDRFVRRDAASGVVYNGTDRYVYIGPADPNSLRVDGDATVLIDGEAVAWLAD